MAEELKNGSLLSIATVVLPQHQSLICLDRVFFSGDNEGVACLFSWGFSL